MSKKSFLLLFLSIIIFVFIMFFITKNFIIKEDDIDQSNIPYLFNNIIPDGFSKVELSDASWNLDKTGRPIGWNNGLVIEDYLGNQFVWVPCSISDSDLITYGRYSYSKDDMYLSKEEILNSKGGDSYIDNEIVNNEIRASIEKYGGFYIGRYETGIEGGQLTYKKNVGKISNWTGWIDGNAAVKQDLQPWNYITLAKAEEISNSFIENKTVASSILTSYCYDTTLKWFSCTNSSFYNNIYNYGNFNNNGQDGLLRTGTFANAKLNNVYDLIGNLHEWSTEKCITPMAAENNLTAVIKGGYWKNHSSLLYERPPTFPYQADISIGFRIILYLK